MLFYIHFVIHSAVIKCQSKNEYEVIQVQKDMFKDYKVVSQKTNLPKNVPFTKVKHLIYKNESDSAVVMYRTSLQKDAPFQSIPFQKTHKTRSGTHKEVVPLAKVIKKKIYIDKLKVKYIKYLYKYLQYCR